MHRNGMHNGMFCGGMVRNFTKMLPHLHTLITQYLLRHNYIDG